ncbi:SDR family NAD(P)-dependent oxidoreductase [Pseudoroseicyclus sp. CXY001]|uniref:SDR family NAD(P)-dependent oxidoreductase n=1 Tax=Pseudoroseicyclus sp. CXY001 TaxID=3242492 RepID=UPI00357127FB
MSEPRPIVVTGASRGIGLELARQLVARGQPVIGIARQVPGPDAPGLRFLRCDLSDRQATAALAETLAGLSPRGLINNAAVQTECDPLRLSPERRAAHIGAELEVNLAAPLILATTLLPVIGDAPDGFVCNVNSCLSLAPKTRALAYCAAKAGLGNATHALRARAREWPDLLVSEALLPLVATDMTAGRGRGKISAEAAAEGILRGIDRRRETIRIGGARALHGIWRLSPGVARRMLSGPGPGPAQGRRGGA